jgi:hypothetical protein
VNSTMISFLLSTGVVFFILLSATTYYLWRRAQSSKKDWEQLMARLIMVDREGIDRVALDAIEPSGRRRTDQLARELTADQIWKLLGGLDGIEVLEKNSRVLVEMAMHLQKWYPEAAGAAEDLRLQAKELQWHVERLRMAADKGHLEFHFASYAQNATVDYYLMTQRLVALAEGKPLPRYANVGRVLNR